MKYSMALLPFALCCINIITLCDTEIKPLNERLELIELKLAIQDSHIDSLMHKARSNQNSNNTIKPTPHIIEPTERERGIFTPSQVIYKKFPQDFPKSFQTMLAFLEDPKPFLQAKAKVPNKFLLSGPPGCGKSYLAELLAHEFQLPMIYVKASDLEDKFYGESSRKITEIFNTRDPHGRRPLLLFIDEVDAIAVQRKDTTPEGLRATINAFLIELQKHSFDSSIIIILATNNKQVLDPALLNRFEGLCVEMQQMSQRDRELFISDVLSHISVVNKDTAIKSLAKKAAGLSRRAIATALESAYSWSICRNYAPRALTIDEIVPFILQAHQDRKTSWFIKCHKFITNSTMHVNYVHALLGTMLIGIQIATNPWVIEKVLNKV